MTGNFEQLVDRICDVVADLPGDVDTLVHQHVGAIAPLLYGTARDELVSAAIARLVGLDQLELLMAAPDIDEILVNRGGEVWIERNGRLIRSESLRRDALETILERILAPLGRRLDRSHPIVDARLDDGSRLCAVIAPVAVDGTALSIRRFHHRRLPLEAFGEPAVVEILRRAVADRANILISGGTSSGKTSLLGALLTTLNADERVVLIEDTTELQPPLQHLVRLEARPQSPDGPAAISLEQLVRTALRLRPDRLIVGEVRGAEVLALLQALNTGHDGSLSTCHANSPADALGRLEALVLQAAPTWPLAAIRSQMARSIDLVVQVARTGSSARHITHITALAPVDDTAVLAGRPVELIPIVEHGAVVGR